MYRYIARLDKLERVKMPGPTLDKLPFTLANLPWGVISTPGTSPRCALAIGDHAIDLTKYASTGRLADISHQYGGVEFDLVFGKVSLPF